ncbi:hypothetical protein P7M46_09165, partial [Bisgaard Taxon 10/6]|uniref:bacteriophage T4 gp5 trimerisation domain-containing protein n=1 Tax=Exercitatus varius TaxID=67857 RepID=UPI00294AE8EE
RTETVGLDEVITINRDQQHSIGRNRITKIEKDEILNINNQQQTTIHADYTIDTGNDYTIEVSGSAEWTAGELIEHQAEIFHSEGYEEVVIESQAGKVIINGEGITLIGHVTIEGSLAYESGSPEMVNVLKLAANKGQEMCVDCLRLKLQQES